MKRVLKFRLSFAATLLACLIASSCTRGVDEIDLGNVVDALPAKQSAIQKHIADHQKERTRAGEAVKLAPVV